MVEDEPSMGSNLHCTPWYSFLSVPFFFKFSFFEKCGPFKKVFIEFVTLLLLFYALVFWLHVM